MAAFHHTDQQLLCSKCGEIQELFDATSIEVFVCPTCFQVHHETNEKYGKLPLNDKKINIALQLNDEGKYFGRKFKVVGKAKKQDKKLFNTVWTEYVIQYEEDKTFAYFNFWQGHWTFVNPVKIDNIKFDANNYKDAIFFKDRYFSFYARYKYETISLIGAFPYDPIDVRNVVAYDFIAPPKILFIEKEGEKEANVFKGRYVYPKEMAEIFNKPILEFKDRTGVAPSQPFYGGLSVTNFNRILMVFLLVFTFVFIFTENAKQSKTLAIIDGTYNNPLENAVDTIPSESYIETSNEDTISILNTGVLPTVESLNKELVTKTFVLPKQIAPQNIDFELDCPISNHWMELQISVVNESNGMEYETAIGVEYYEGVDNGYSWTEGSQNSTIKLTGLSEGKYHLKVKCLTNHNLSFNYRLYARTGSTGYWNYFFVLITSLVSLAIVNILKSQFEKVRNGENDNLFS